MSTIFLTLFRLTGTLNGRIIVTVEQRGVDVEAGRVILLSVKMVGAMSEAP